MGKKNEGLTIEVTFIKKTPIEIKGEKERLTFGTYKRAMRKFSRLQGPHESVDQAAWDGVVYYGHGPNRIWAEQRRRKGLKAQ